MRLALSLLLALSTLGCAGLTDPIEQPTAELERVSIASMSLTGAVLRADFNVTNPNSISIPIKAVDWEVSIGGAEPFRGRAEVDTTIPAYGSAPLAVDVELSAVTAVTTIKAISGGARDYRIGGVIHFATPVGQISMTFQEEGTISDDALGAPGS